MANFLLCYDNQADQATLTGGSYAANYPRDNLKDYRLRKTARTSDATATNTKVRFAFAAAVYIQAVVLAATNATTAATYRLQLFSDAGFSVQVYDSGTLDLFPAGSMPNSEIPAGAPNAGTGKPTEEEVARFQCNVIHLLGASAQYAQYGELQITDTANPDGYLEAGRLFVGRVFQPARNPQYGKASLRLASRTAVTRARDGTPYFTAQRPDFSIPFALEWLTKDEAMRVLDLQAIVDTYGEVLVAWDADDAAYWWRRQVFGRLKQLDPIEHPMYATYATAFQVEGVL